MSDKMQVKVLEDELKSDGFHLFKDNVAPVPVDVGTRWCKLGWAEDTSGQVATGERNLNPIEISPKSTKQTQGE